MVAANTLRLSVHPGPFLLPNSAGRLLWRFAQNVASDIQADI